MPTAKLTKRFIDAYKVPTHEKFVWDTEITGFGIRVQPTGRRVFVFKCRPGGGRAATQRKMTIGEYGPVTVDQARREAQRMAGEVAAGRDPGATRNDRRAASRSARAAATVATLGNDFLDDVRARRKMTTAREYARLWDKHIVPALRSRKVADVTVADVSRLHRKMHATPYAANRVLALLGSFFSFAEQHGARPRHTNPAPDVEPYPEHARERYLTADEVSRLGEALERALREGLPPAPTRRRKRKRGATAKHRPKSADVPKPANPYAVAALRFLILTGWREREALTLQWAHIDLEHHRAILPDTKTGRSYRELGAPACLLLSTLPRVEGSPYVFPGKTANKALTTGEAPDHRPLVEINRLWYAARHAAGLTDVRLHDLRHSYASVVASNGGSLLVIGKLLGHRNPATTARYAHLHDRPVQSAANMASNELAGRLGIPQAKADADGSADGSPRLRIAR